MVVCVAQVVAGSLVVPLANLYLFRSSRVGGRDRIHVAETRLTMPTKQQYPEGWDGFSARIRFGRAGRRCECEGECGLHQAKGLGDRGDQGLAPNRLPLIPSRRRCSEQHGALAEFAAGHVVLTVAHLCKCSPPCAIPEHVKAMCQRCHLRIDVELHVKHAASTRMRKKESAGQSRLEW